MTCYEAVHDASSSFVVDYHFRPDGQPLEEINDSVWNFHVWNEAWIRPSIPSAYSFNDEWQAFDATPRESGEGPVPAAGPVPLKSIRNGEYLPDNASLFYFSVNGERMNWTVHENGQMTLDLFLPYSIGCRISTKGIGRDEREDITHLYKHPDGKSGF